MQFKVQQQYERGGEATIAQFTNQADAELFIREKIKDAINMKIRVAYILLAPNKSPQKFTPDASSTSSPAPSSQGTKSGSSPTPLSTVPRPSGMPANWRRDKDEDEK